jgi:hypothetical protein
VTSSNRQLPLLKELKGHQGNLLKNKWGTRGTLEEPVQIQTIVKGEQKKSFRIKID